MVEPQGDSRAAGVRRRQYDGAVFGEQTAVAGGQRCLRVSEFFKLHFAPVEAALKIGAEVIAFPVAHVEIRIGVKATADLILRRRVEADADDLALHDTLEGEGEKRREGHNSGSATAAAERHHHRCRHRRHATQHHLAAGEAVRRVAGSQA